MRTRGTLPLHIRTEVRSGRDVIILSTYKDPHISEAVCALKFDKDEAAAQLLARLLDDFLYEELADRHHLYSEKIACVPIPLGEKRLVERGKNQIDRILEQSQALRDAEVPIAHLLVRTRDTSVQSTLSKQARYANIADAFAVSSTHTPFPYKTVYLIDDVVSTGATMNEAARTLEASGLRVLALAIAG